MNPRELVDHIRSGPAELVLDKPLRFRRRTRSNPCDFNEFLQALHSSETIVGRGRLLSSSQTTRKEWVEALNQLNQLNCSYVGESPEYNISCLYSLLRLNPATCML
jgi:hypothetical protein